MLFISNRLPQWFVPISKSIEQRLKYASAIKARLSFRTVGSKEFIRFAYTNKLSLYCNISRDIAKNPNAAWLRIRRIDAVSYDNFYPEPESVLDTTIDITSQEGINTLRDYLAEHMDKVNTQSKSWKPIVATGDIDFFDQAEGKKLVYYNLDTNYDPDSETVSMQVINHNDQHMLVEPNMFYDNFVTLD